MNFGFSISLPVILGSLPSECIIGLWFDPRQTFQGCCDALSLKPMVTTSNVAMTMASLLSISGKPLD